MPIPMTSVGAAIKFLHKEKPMMKHNQIVAIALSKLGKSKKKKI